MKFIKQFALVTVFIFSIDAVASPLTDKNINKFLVIYSNDYATHAVRLVRGYKKYKAKDNDYKGFVLFRNKEWAPKYEIDMDFYSHILEENRIYLFNNDLTFLIGNMINLRLRANSLFFGLKNNDNDKLKKTSLLMQSDTKELIDLFKKKGIEFNPIVRP